MKISFLQVFKKIGVSNFVLYQKLMVEILLQETMFSYLENDNDCYNSSPSNSGKQLRNNNMRQNFA